MIRLRVEWHRKCSCCGTEIVVDFFDDSVADMNCPWCGESCELEQNCRSESLRQYLSTAIEDIEQRVNGRIAVP